MKKLFVSVCILTLFTAVFTPKIASADDTLAQIAIKLITQKFGVSAQQVAAFQNQTHQNIYEAAPIYSTSYYTHRPVDDVWKLRQQGLGWGEVAHRLGMNPGKFNKLRKAGAFDRDAIWGTFARERYGARESDLASIRRRGGTSRDILSSAVIAKYSRKDPTVVYKRYQSNRDWDRISHAYQTESQRRKGGNQHSDKDDQGNSSRGESDHGNRADSDKHPNRDNGNGKGHGGGKDRDDDKKGHDRGNGKGPGNGKSDDQKDGKSHGKGD